MAITKDQSRMARAAIDISLRQLNEHTGLSGTTVYQFERGQTKPTDATLARLEEYFGSFVIFVPPSPGRHGPGVLMKDETALAELVPIDETGEQLLQHFKDRPESWAALPEETKAVMLSAIFGRVPDVDPIGGV